MDRTRTIFAIVAASFLMTLTQPASAQIDRTRQPEPDPAPKFAFPDYEEMTLDNGMKVFLVRDERPIVTFRMLFRGGNGTDGDIPGLSDAAADLMIKGTTNYSALEFAKKIDFVGGSIEAGARPDAITVTASGLKRHLPTILPLYAEAVMNPVYPADELEKYKQEQLTSLQQGKASADFLATHAVNRLLFGDTPYGRMPSSEAISALTPQKIADYHDTYIVPNNAMLAVVGDIEKGELKEMLEETFAGWKRKDVSFPNIRFPEWEGRRVVVVDRPTSVQSSMRIVTWGPKYDNPNRPKLTILNSILGGGTGLGNRLAMNLRETHAYTYTPYSYFDANLYGGSFLAAADVRNSVTDSAIVQTLYEIERLQSETVPQDELQRNIESAIGSYLMSLANPSNTAARVQSINLYGLPDDYYDNLVSVYNATTAQDVRNLAKQHLALEKMAIVVVGKADEIKDKLKPFGAEVEVWNTDMEPEKQAAALPLGLTVEKVWGGMLKAMGGEEEMKEVKSIKMTGTLEIPAGPGTTVSADVEEVRAHPNRLYREIMIPGQGGQQTYINGTTAVEVMGPRRQELEGDELAARLEDSHILSEAYVQDMGGSVKLKGAGQVNGQSAYLVEVTLPNAGTSTYYLSSVDFLPMKVVDARGAATIFESWGTVGDLKLPTRLSMEPQPGVQLTLKDIAYELDVPVKEEMFSPN